MHVVLGSGVTGREVVAALRRRGLPVTCVTRSGTAPRNTAARHVVADLRDPAAAHTALADAEVAYLTVGLPYRSRVWEQQWPTLLRNVMRACVDRGTRLVFLDNVYAYGEVTGAMTEATPLSPRSRKGRLRAQLIELIDEAKRTDGLQVSIGRSADFYGPGATTSAFNNFVVNAVADGKRPTWFVDATQPHALSYTPDIGEALAVLGTDPRGRTGIWHLPTAPALTGSELMALASGSAEHKTTSLGILRFGGLFSSDARETAEMAYQYAKPYRFDSTRFERTFGFMPTPHTEGIAASLAAARGARLIER